ncbi:hypothetical protein pipiens_003390 [Culex pipiens pipiens]|uniref:Uncharacterized protein n=1 Tax=Culex pipiens pipiens TaxID=38569 RepID=A0ABD1D1N8_CULPP
MAFHPQLLSILTILVIVHGSIGYSLRYHTPGHSSKLSEPAYGHHLKVLPSTVYFYDAIPPPPPKPSFQILFGCGLKVPSYSSPCQPAHGLEAPRKEYRTSYKGYGNAFVVLVAVQGSTGYALWYHAPGHCSKQSEPVHDYLQDQEAPEPEIFPSTVYFYDCEGPPQTKAGYQLLFGCQLEGPVFGGCEENREYREYQQYQKVSPCDLDWAVYRKAYKPYSRAASGHSGAY